MLIPADVQFGPEGPGSLRYRDRYAGPAGALAQAEGVFLAGCGLPDAWRGRHRFTILETGFGLGFNLLACWKAWRQTPEAPAQLHFLSIERHPVALADLAEAHRAEPALAREARELRLALPPAIPGCHRISLADGRLQLTLVYGHDAAALAELDGVADAIFLDGFAPDRNPDMWSDAVMGEVARLAAPGARLASWTAAGAVRRRLTQHGFDVSRGPAFGSKRETTRALRRESRGPAAPGREGPPQAVAGAEGRSALVIGGGLAGCQIAARLGQRGWSVQLLEAASRPAQAASGNPAAVVRPLISRDDNRVSRFTRACFLYAQQVWRGSGGAQPGWHPTGVVQIAHDGAQHRQWQATLAEQPLPGEFVSLLDTDAAVRRTGLQVPHGGLMFPGGGWAQPSLLCAQALVAAGAGLVTRWGAQVATLLPLDGGASGWRALGTQGQVLGEAAHVVVASGAGTPEDAAGIGPGFLPAEWRALQRLRGEITVVRADALAALDLVVCGDGYVCPDLDGHVSLGATYDRGGPASATAAGVAENLGRLQGLLGIPPAAVSTLDGRAAWRSIAPDRVPVVGADPWQAGLWHFRGLASRGVVWSPLLAELLACDMNHEPSPLASSLRALVGSRRPILNTARPT